jgi:hypothetical protein
VINLFSSSFILFHGISNDPQTAKQDWLEIGLQENLTYAGQDANPSLASLQSE